MFPLHRRDLQRDGPPPSALATAGCNAALTPTNNAGFLAWIVHGGLVAQPSLRGGSEYAEDWQLNLGNAE